MTSLKSTLHLKFRSVNCLNISESSKQLSNIICPMAFSRIFLRETFCKLLSKHLWRSLHLINFRASSMFLWKSLDGCIQVWRLFLWRNLFLRLKHQSVSCLKLKKPLCKNIRWTIKAGVYSFKSSDSCPFSKNRNYT